MKKLTILIAACALAFGAVACSKKNAATTPAPAAADPMGGATYATPSPDAANPCGGAEANPCGGM
jgi:hypothetical protein